MWFGKKVEHYKIKSLKTYAWDRAINNTRRFRKVFDKLEINYLSVALEFYNKLFDEKDWKVTITFKAFSIENDKKTIQHCSNTKEYKITKDCNTFLCDYGWGNDEYGTYWKQGDYIWEVYIDNEFIESTKFHIEDVGLVTPANNPYFKVLSLKTLDILREEGKEDIVLNLKHFLYNHTTYITTQIELQNKVSHKWLCELFFNYYDDSGLLIGSSQEIGFVNSQNTTDKNLSIIIKSNWGSQDPTIWLKDNYRVEVVFMETVVAVIPFGIADELMNRENENEALLNEEVAKIYEVSKDDDFKPIYAIDENDYVADTIEKPKVINTDQPVLATSNEEDKILERKPLEELVSELNKLIGLNEIKQKIKEYIDYVFYLKLRAAQGINEDDPISLHSVFTGNPGTGKTTVVKLLGEIYKSIGLLSKGHVVTVDSNDLVSGYVRQTGEATKEFIKKAQGGILFIDEAYMLFKNEAPNDFGTEAIATLITEMSDGKGDIAIMVAGYPEEMEIFINSNPGLKSRFTNYYHFKDYTPTELVAIAKYAAEKKQVQFSEKALEKLKKIVTNAYRKRDKTFGNARFVHAIIDEAKMDLGIRLIRNSKEKNFTKTELLTILEEDIELAILEDNTTKLNLETDTELLNEALLELNKLTGLEQVKKEIQELIRLTKYYKEINRDILKAFSLHSVFIGNPGTGKTTVARIIGKVYKALGLLERGHVVEADGSSLIAGFVGQSAIKTKELIKSAMGGVLFIDEAYAITEGISNNGNDFGKKAIATLLKEMEDKRGAFCVIVAGYTDNMNQFLESNPGLKSRFDKTFNFQDFSKNELLEIVETMLASKNLKAEEKAKEHLKKYINYLHNNRNKFFGNARSMRKIVEKSIRNQELRLADLEHKKRTKKMISTLFFEDVEEFTSEKIESSKRIRIGYK